MNALFFINSIGFGIGLAMDAFSVSLANGLNEPGMNRRRMSLIAGTFAVFQCAMPLIGWLCIHYIADKFNAFERAVPWIALVLLLYIGIKMLIDGLKHNREDRTESDDTERLGIYGLIIQGIATSIDALSVGFTISDYDLVGAVVEAVIIGIVTFVICIGGLKIGKKFGMKLAGKASILGGIILIAIGLEIFIKGMM